MWDSAPHRIYKHPPLALSSGCVSDFTESFLEIKKGVTELPPTPNIHQNTSSSGQGPCQPLASLLPKHSGRASCWTQVSASSPSPLLLSSELSPGLQTLLTLTEGCPSLPCCHLSTLHSAAGLWLQGLLSLEGHYGSKAQSFLFFAK